MTFTKNNPIFLQVSFEPTKFQKEGNWDLLISFLLEKNKLLWKGTKVVVFLTLKHCRLNCWEELSLEIGFQRKRQNHLSRQKSTKIRSFFYSNGILSSLLSDPSSTLLVIFVAKICFEVDIDQKHAICT